MPDPPFSSLTDPSFIELQSVDSTNNYARQLIHAGLAQHGMVVFTYEQLAGKGQRGKAWHAEKDVNILLSILIKPKPLNPGEQFMLSAGIATALYDFFSQYAGDDTKIKWPNDLYWQDRKAGGVLIETVIRSHPSEFGSQEAEWEWAIAGIGININQTVFPDNIPNPVSLKQITGKNYDPLLLAKEVTGLINKKVNDLITEGFENIYTKYLEHLYKKDAIVKLKKDNHVFEALIKSVSPKGKLIIQHSIEEEIDFGNIEWMLK